MWWSGSSCPFRAASTLCLPTRMRRIGAMSLFNPDRRSDSACMTPRTKKLPACSALICNKGDTAPLFGTPPMVDPTAWHSVLAIKSTHSSSSMVLSRNLTQLNSENGSLLTSTYRSSSWLWRLAITECINFRCLLETELHAPGWGTCSPSAQNFGLNHAITESKIWWNTELGPLLLVGSPLDSCLR